MLSVIVQAMSKVLGNLFYQLLLRYIQSCRSRFCFLFLSFLCFGGKLPLEATEGGTGN